ncbi:MAG: glycosyltransferase, partial [Acidimicrobiales bacterium]
MPAVVVVPTFQEAANIGVYLRAMREAAPDVDILVVDDNSPDGTADLAEKAAAELGHIAVLQRSAK